jgi:hypothetical protein
VGDAVEGAVAAMYDSKDRAAEATGAARSTAAGAVGTARDAGRRLGRRAVEALETEEARAAREEAEAVRARGAERLPWWQFWRHGGGLE